MIFDTSGSVNSFQNSNMFKDLEENLKNSDAGKFYCIGDWLGFEKDNFYDIIEETMYDFTVYLNGENFKFTRDDTPYRDYLLRTKFDKQRIREIQLEKL